MPIQIANPQVVEKIERLAKIIGAGKTATIEAAVDRMLAQSGAPAKPSDRWRGVEAAIEQLHRLPPRQDAYEAVEYDELGLPK
jgi:antitoxin VapB